MWDKILEKLYFLDIHVAMKVQDLCYEEEKTRK